jgi:Mor family transcriptional regulator
MARRHLEAVRRYAREIKAAETARNAAMVEAIDSGETYRDVAEAAGLSHQRVWQIVKTTRQQDR